MFELVESERLVLQTAYITKFQGGALWKIEPPNGTVKLKPNLALFYHKALACTPTMFCHLKANGNNTK